MLAIVYRLFLRRSSLVKTLTLGSSWDLCQADLLTFEWHHQACSDEWHHLWPSMQLSFPTFRRISSQDVQILASSVVWFVVGGVMVGWRKQRNSAKMWLHWQYHRRGSLQTVPSDFLIQKRIQRSKLQRASAQCSLNLQVTSQLQSRWLVFVVDVGYGFTLFRRYSAASWWSLQNIDLKTPEIE